jgi:hypothetical protein
LGRRRRDLRRTLGLQSDALRVGFLSILQWEKGGWRGMGIRKNTCKGDEGRCWSLSGRSLGLSSQPYELVFLWLLF